MKLLYTLLFAFFISCSTEPEDKDCAGVAGGSAYLDDCGFCDVNAINDNTTCVQDECGVWGGDNSTCEDYNAINIYELEDLNANSSTFGQTLNHNTFLGKVILYYFPISDTWSLCKSRFDSLNEIYLEYGGVNGNIIIIGVGKNDGNSIYTVAKDTILPYIKETDEYRLRGELDVIDRDVYFYNTTGEYVHKVNLTDEFDKNIIESIINGILNETP